MLPAPPPRSAATTSTTTGTAPEAAPWRGTAASDSRELGFELDLGASLQLDRHTAFGAGWSHFFPGAFFRRPGAHDAMDSFQVTLVYMY